MIELLVVIVILAILVSVVLVASSTLINNSRVTNTKAVLQLVSDAVQEFKRERPGIVDARQAGAGGAMVSYMKRYGPYPPDELDVFTKDVGIPGSTGANPRSLAPGGATMYPGAPYDSMKFYLGSDAIDNQEHRDLAAMIVAIETLTESAASILDKIPDRNRSVGPVLNGQPMQFLDRPPPSTQFQNEDHQIRYIVDDWGVPLSYMTQRDWVANPAAPTAQAPASSNHPKWTEASTSIVRLNSNEPLILSWGPDGKDQLTKDVMENEGKASLVFDYLDPATPPHRVDHIMNADNVYLDDALRDRLSGEAQQ